MSEYFQAKVSSLQQQSNGLIAKVVETYLIDAMSFTEAEARAIKESEGSREVTAVAIARSPIKEVVMYGDTDQFFKVKVQYSLMDEATEKEKKVTTYFLVNANDAKEAYERTEEHLKEMLVPFTIPKIEESPIIEVYQYEKQAPAGYVKRDRQQVMDKTDKRVQMLKSSGGIFHGVTGMMINRNGHEVPMQFAVDATDEQWDAFIDGDEADGGMSHDGDGKENEAKSLFESLPPIHQEWILKAHANGDHLKETSKEFLAYVRSEAGRYGITSLQMSGILDYLDDKDEHEEECAFEGDSVEAHYTKTPTEYITNPKAGLIDPTDGQAVAFVADPLRLLLESFGLTVSDEQLEEIEEMHEACGMVEFSEFMEIEHGLSLGDAVLVSNLLK